MNDVVIRAKDLKKVYRLYAKPSYRFRDMFGLLRRRDGAYTEHAALDGVDLEIRRGEKVAIIGRNGAGKSTLLKLITNVTQPTSGLLDVSGRVHALLQLGTGFHPDFTGRENLHAYFAQLGITGPDAERRFADAIEFAEIEEYIDQPVKTYSTGMAVRLMFSASTAISPELLVLDEVLGVGDAYFAQKSFDRMRELCEHQKTTLLLVTHDVYSAVRLCERIIWIDRGRVLCDADGPTVVGMYEDSIRQQEEHRLRMKAGQRARELGVAAAEAPRVHVEIHSLHNVPQASPVYFSRIELFAGDRSLGRLPIDATPDDRRAWLQMEGTAWGEPCAFQGRAARPFLNFGSPFHKVAGVVALERNAAGPLSVPLRVEAEYWSEAPCQLAVHCFVDGRDVQMGSLPPSTSSWVAASVSASGRSVLPVSAGSGRQGTGAIVIKHVRPLDAGGAETYSFKHGAPFVLELAYRINQPGLRERPQVLIAFHRDGVQDVMRSISRELLFEESRAREGVVLVRFPEMPLAAGSYSVTVMLAKEGYYDESQPLYFSVNPGVYTCLTRVFDIVIEGGGVVAEGTGVVADAQWSLIPTGSLRTSGQSYRLDFPDVIAREFRDGFGDAWSATERVLAQIRGVDFSNIAEHSPGLRGYDWTVYLQCSVIRLTRVLRALRTFAPPTARVLDLGAYFGNASLMCASAGYRVDAIDGYRTYAPAFDGCVQLMTQSGVRVLDFADCGFELEKMKRGTYDVVLCLGVIEHIAHTPRPLLESMNRVLNPGGVLVLDTPNGAYLYNRMKFARGESVLPPVVVQFGVTPPFEGHHREYTTSELRWMLEALGHEILELSTFNYSMYALTEMTREQLFHFGQMEAEPELRELMLSVSRKPT